MSFSKLLGISFALFSAAVSTCTLAAEKPSAPVNPLTHFKESPEWTSAAAVSAVGKKLQIDKKPQAELNTILVNTGDFTKSKHLVGKYNFGDTLLDMEFLVAQGTTAKVFIHGHYAIELKNKNNEWQSLSVKFRAPRFNEASEKSQNAMFLEIRINGEIVSTNQILTTYSENALTNWESEAGQTTILANQGQFAFRNFKAQPADYSNLVPPAQTGGTTNLTELVDYVALGRETFESVGCNVCHSVAKDDATVTTGPNLFGLFTREPRAREVAEGGEGHRFNIKADREYLHRSVRSPSDQVAITEKGAKKGEAYPPIMPPFNAQVISDTQVDAIGAYLTTLNDPQNQGPVIKLMKQGVAEKYDPLEDRLQLLVDDQVRIQRGPVSGVSGRAVHVGLVNGVNYSFDPRILAIAKIWQGGFLDMTGEFTNRGGKGLKTGFESREISLGDKEYLIAPLNAAGATIDFSFKNAKFGDTETVKKSLNSKQDHLDTLASVDAQFLGYTRNSKDKTQAPSFKYRIGKNTLAVQTSFEANGNVKINVSGDLKTEQAFALNTSVLGQPQVTVGKIEKGQAENTLWTLPAGKINATLSSKVALATNVWHAPKSTFDNRKQALKVTSSKASMPAGYSIESYYPPKDNFGREQLFEALGVVIAKDGTIVVATRTAGIWRLVKGEWQLFAEGTFDSLGVLVEDSKGLTVVAGQKAELTRISDSNGDGIADNYDTVFDAHSYHGNYHSYMHGPARGADGAYYLSINLADGGDGSAYNAGGKYMGTPGGFAGWNIRVDANDKKEVNKFSLWANGLRSPAGLALGPDGRLWYSENQGEYVGTSKVFVLEQNKFYGHPSSLVDLPGMTPDSPEIAWSNYVDKRVMAAVLLPHNKVANSPGNPAWDTTKGKFGVFGGQMLIGDQTQSNLLRVQTDVVDGVEQGSVMPFIDGLESGVMRPVFLPDGSLLLGQTGRGWQAKGGHVASMQRILWDGKTVAPAIHSTRATSSGFTLQLTQPLNENIDAAKLQGLLAVESWVYRDAPDYGSDELGKAMERITNISISADRKQITMSLAELSHASVHPQQTARVYHIALNSQNLFKDAAAAQLHTYYTLYKFAKAN